MRVLLALIFMSHFATAGIAAASTIHSVNAGFGTSQFSGSLSNEQRGRLHGISVDLVTARYDKIGGITTSLMLDMWETKARQDHAVFPFNAGENLSLNTFAILSNFCFQANSPVDLCVGAGPSLVSVRDQTENKQTYGTVGFTYGIGRLQREGLVIGVRGRYDRVNQKTAGRDSFFAMSNNMVVLGWSWIQ